MKFEEGINEKGQYIHGEDVVVESQGLLDKTTEGKKIRVVCPSEEEILQIKHSITESMKENAEQELHKR